MFEKIFQNNTGIKCFYLDYLKRVSSKDMFKLWFYFTIDYNNKCYYLKSLKLAIKLDFVVVHDILRLYI